MAETSIADSPQEELEYGSEPANEVEAGSHSPRARGRKRRSADVNNGLASPSTSVEPKDPAQGKRARGEEAGGKRVRKANPMFADYYPTDKKTAHALLGQEPTNGKGRKEILMTPAEARTKKLAKGYQYVAADETKPPVETVQPLPGKRERKKPVHADFVDEVAAVAGTTKPPGKKISVTISNPNTNPTLSVSAAAAAARRGRTPSGGISTPEPALADTDDKPAKRTKSEQSRQAKLDFTLTMLNDQLAAVTSSIRNKETVSLPPVEPEASNSTSDSPQDDQEIEEAEDFPQSSASIPQSPITPATSAPTTPATNNAKGRGKKPKPESAGRAKRGKPRPQSPPSPVSPATPLSTSRPVRTRKVRTPSAIAGDVYLSRGLVKCQDLIRELLKHEHAWPFAKPVDPVQLNIPDYFDIIKHPMDLGTVKTQLNNGHYDHLDAFADDVRLVFLNTRTYNKPDSDIVYMARMVEETFERKIASLKAQGIDDFEDDGDEASSPSSAKIEERIQQLSSQLKVATEEIKRLKQNKQAPIPGGAAAATPAKSSKGRPRDDNRPMSFEEKRRLSVQINTLSSEKLGKVVQIIHESNPKLAQSSAPDVIEIDIDALDTSTLRHLERVVRQSQPRQRSTSSAGASPAPSRLAQAELAASGTKERIADVKRQLDALNRSLGTKKKNAKKGTEDEDVVIDDEAPSKSRDSDSGSSSDSSSSDSSSESDSSETSSDSDSESDQEQAKPPQPKFPSLPTANVPKFPFPVNLPIQTTAITVTPIPVVPVPQPTTFAPLPRTPPPHDGVVFSLEKPPVSALPNEAESDIPEIKPSTGTKKAPEAISWNTTVLETPAVVESPATPPPVAAGTTDQMWSQFQNKNILLKQKEKEREEQEELLRKEREEREEERKREEERRKKEMEEAEVRKQRDNEAEKEQKHKQMMEQRAKAKEERERMQGKNMSEQSDMMASFERENRADLPSSVPFQLSSSNPPTSTSTSTSTDPLSSTDQLPAATDGDSSSTAPTSTSSSSASSTPPPSSPPTTTTTTTTEPASSLPLPSDQQLSSTTPA